MTNMREKILKALETCRDQMNPAGYRFTSCDDCPYKGSKYGCVRTLVTDAIDYIKAQEAENT